MSPPRPAGARSGERGAIRGCCLGLALMIVLTGAVAVLLLRLTDTPDLGSPPSGPDDGGSQQAIATTLAKAVASGLSSSAQTTILVSEHDLTVLAAENNPDPDLFTKPQVRSRGGVLVLSAGSHLGPMAVVTTVKLSLHLTGSGGISLGVVELDVGDQVIPGFLRSALDPRGNAPFSFSPFLDATGMSAFRSLLECVVAAPGGIDLGFHRQGSAADPSVCSTAPAAA
ncbi:MAG: hypothetical protein ABSA40_00170 [Candidatus Dormibacteria bacterium]